MDRFTYLLICEGNSVAKSTGEKSYESYQIGKDGTYNSAKQEITEYILTDTNI